MFHRDLVDKPFFPKMMEYMISGPVVCMAWEGKDVVRMGRKMLGATNPLESEPGTIRGDFALEVRGRRQMKSILRQPCWSFSGERWWNHEVLAVTAQLDWANGMTPWRYSRLQNNRTVLHAIQL